MKTKPKTTSRRGGKLGGRSRSRSRGTVGRGNREILKDFKKPEIPDKNHSDEILGVAALSKMSITELQKEAKKIGVQFGGVSKDTLIQKIIKYRNEYGL